MFNDINGEDESSQASREELDPPARSRRLWKFLFGFIAIIVIVGGGYYAWLIFLNPDARNRISPQEMQENYELFTRQKTLYEEAMKNDTYGGKTPEETLALFIKALEKGDVDLASKYFLIGEKITQKEWADGLKTKGSSGGLEKIIEIIRTAKPSNRDTGSPHVKEFVVFSNDQTVDYSIILKLNTFSNVWKIESL